MSHFPDTATSHIAYPVGPTASTAASLTAHASANTKGSYTELVSAITFAANSVEVWVGATTTTTGGILIDVATGAAAAETVVLPDLLAEGTAVSASKAGGNYGPFHLAIASGARVAMRCQAATGGITVSHVGIVLHSSGDTPGASAYVSYGTDTATSLGTTVDPGGVANTKGGYAQITSATANIIQHLVFTSSYRSNGGPLPDGMRWAIDLATGAGGAEAVLIPDLRRSVGFGNFHLYPRSHALLTYIPSGTRLAMRASCDETDATDRLFAAAILGGTGSGTQHYPQSTSDRHAITYSVGPTALAVNIPTPGVSNTKGSYTIFTTSAPFDVNAVVLHDVANIAASRQYLIDLATGAAGAETVAVANLLAEGADTASEHCGGRFAFPLSIISGTRIAGRIQVNNTTGDMEIALTLVGAGNTLSPDAWTTYGADTSDSGGTSVDPGGTANVKGAYSELTASTTSVHRSLMLAGTIRGNTAPTSALWVVDLATGAGGAETVLMPDLRYGMTATDSLFTPRSYTIPAYVASSTRLAVRTSCSINTAGDRLLDVEALGTTESFPDTACMGGGDVVIVADEADGETFSGRAISPRVWFTLAYDDQDRSYSLDTLNHVPNYHNGRKPGYLVNVGTITRQLSDRFSSYKMADCAVEVDNHSRFMDTLETTAASQHWANREGRIHLASPTTIQSGGTAHTLFRGIWRQNRSRGLQRFLTLTDILGSEFSDLNLEGTIPQRLIGDDFSDYDDIPDDSLTKVVPTAYGSFDDRSIATVDVGSPLTFDSTKAAPTGAGTIATDGLGTINGGACARVAAVFAGNLEGPLTPPGGLYFNPGDSFFVHWATVDGAIGYRIYLSDSGDFDPYHHPEQGTYHRLITVSTTTVGEYAATVGGAEATFTAGTGLYGWDFSLLMHTRDDGIDALDDAGTSAQIDTGHGVVSPVYVGTEDVGGTTYHAWVLCGHAIQHIHELYVDGVALNIDSDTAQAGSGGIWLVPGFDGYIAQFGTATYRTINGHRYTMILGKVGSYGPDRAAGIAQRSTLSNNALQVDEFAPFAVNFCAIEDVGDGTGNTITNAARQVFHLLNQWVLQSYETGAWAAPAESADGVPWLNSQSFSEAEIIEINRVGGEGYVGAIYLNEPLTVRQLLARLQENFDMRFGQNEHGQVIVKHLNDDVDLSTVDTVNDVQEISEPTEMDPRLNELENRVVYDWGYRFSDQVFTHEGEQVEDAIAIAANRNRAAVGDRRQLIYVRDQTTADDVAGRALAFGKYPPRYVDMVGPLHWLRIKLGDIITATDLEGLGATGWEDRALWVLGISVDIGTLDDPPRVKLSCVDIGRFLETYGVLGDANTLNNWTSESVTNRSTYWFLADKTTGLFSDGAPAKELR